MNRFYEPKSLSRINHCFISASFVVECHLRLFPFVFSESLLIPETLFACPYDIQFVGVVRENAKSAVTFIRIRIDLMHCSTSLRFQHYLGSEDRDKNAGS